jgi:hypothetical protein
LQRSSRLIHGTNNSLNRRTHVGAKYKRIHLLQPQGPAPANGIKPMWWWKRIVIKSYTRTKDDPWQLLNGSVYTTFVETKEQL